MCYEKSLQNKKASNRNGAVFYITQKSITRLVNWLKTLTQLIIVEKMTLCFEPSRYLLRPNTGKSRWIFKILKMLENELNLQHHIAILT